MRSSSLVLGSLVLVLFLSGFAGRGPVIGSEAGLTAGTPVLTEAELKALAPDPMPVIEDPATEIKVTLKPVAAAEAAAARAALPKKPAKKPAAKPAKKTGEIVLTLAGDSEPARKRAPKKADAKAAKTPAKKTEAKKTVKDAKVQVAKKATKPGAKTTASKPAKDAGKQIAKKAAKPGAKPAAKKTAKDAKTQLAKKPSTAKPAKKPAKPLHQARGAAKIGRTRVLPEDLEAGAEDASAEGADEGDEGDEQEAPAEPATKAVKTAKAATAPKPLAAKAKPAVAERAEDEEAPAPADPTVIAAADAEKYRATITAFLAKIAAPEAGGSASAQVGAMKRGTLNNKPVVLVDGARVIAQSAKFQKLHVKRAVMEVRDLALDEAALNAGTCALVGAPTLVPDITLEHRQVQEKVAKNNVRNPRITYENNQMLFAGEVKVMFFKVGFRMAGRFERTGNNISFRIAELFIRNSPASADRLAQAQAKMENMIKLEEALAPIGASQAPVRGGKLSIEDGETVVYSTTLDRPVLAE